MASVNLTHHFLIAMPSMADPYFSKTLTYICEHNDQGALGLVVNRPIDMTLQALFERLSLKLGRAPIADAPVYFGGPVQTDRGFVLHAPAGNWQATLRVRADRCDRGRVGREAAGAARVARVEDHHARRVGIGVVVRGAGFGVGVRVCHRARSSCE